MLILRIASLLSLILICSTAWAASDFAPVFSDNMVLQRGRPIEVWGESDDAEHITLSFAGRSVRASVKDGKWSTQLPPVDAGGPYELTLQADGQTKTLKNILVGDVWLAGGQSNMQWPVNRLHERSEIVQTLASNRNIRLLQIVRNADTSGELTVKPQTGWFEGVGPAVDNYSAVAFYFAHFLQPQIGVPVGIIECDWGGTGAEAWMPCSTLCSRPQFKGLLDAYREEAAKFPERYELYKSAMSQWRKNKKLPMPVMPMGPYHHRRPGGLYETMLSPIAPYTIKGVIFYQGESNRFTPGIYKELFETLIWDWRTAWKDASLPFLFVQLAGYGKADFRAIRAAQWQVWRSVPNTAMATAIDVGEMDNIHPSDKKTVGQRLSNLALHEIYGKKEIPAYGPVAEQVKFDGDVCHLNFSNVDNGLMVKGERLRGFELAGDDRRFYGAEAIIEGDRTVRVWSRSVSSPVAVRYSWKAFPDGNLYNKAALPAFPYKSDAWEDDPEIDLSRLELASPDEPEGAPLQFLPETRESKAMPVRVGEVAAWQSRPLSSTRPDFLRYLYFKVADRDLALRSARQVILRIQFLDMGDTHFRIEYDSADGPWKRYSRDIPVGNSLAWKTIEIPLEDAAFKGRQHGNDVRLRVLDGKNFVVRGVWAAAAE